MQCMFNEKLVISAFSTLMLASCGGDAERNTASLTSAGSTAAASGGEKRLLAVATADIITFVGSYRDHTITRSGTQFVVIDKTGKQTTIPANIQRVQFSDGIIGLDIEGTSGQGYRLYQAAFNRKPDLSGLGYWIDKIDNGLSYYDVAWNFINSEEFKRLYGNNVSNRDFITALYANVLHRAPDEAGFTYWNNLLTNNGITRHAMLAEFSNSVENVRQVENEIRNGVLQVPAGVVEPAAPVLAQRPAIGDPVPPLPAGVAAECRREQADPNDPGLSLYVNCNDTPAYAPALRPGIYIGTTLPTATEPAADCNAEVFEDLSIRLSQGATTIRVLPAGQSSPQVWASIRAKKAPRINEMEYALNLNDSPGLKSAVFKWSGALYTTNAPYSMEAQDKTDARRIVCINMSKQGNPAPAPVVDPTIVDPPLTALRPSPIPDFMPPPETCTPGSSSGAGNTSFLNCYSFEKYVSWIAPGLWQGVPWAVNGSGAPLPGTCTMRLQENGALSIVYENQRYVITPGSTSLGTNASLNEQSYSVTDAANGLSASIFAYAGQTWLDRVQVLTNTSAGLTTVLDCRALRLQQGGQRLRIIPIRQ